MTTRYDITSVPLQGGYVAKQCPVRAQNGVLNPATPLPETPLQRRRFDAGIAFEAQILTRLRALSPTTVVVEGEDAEARETATLAAMTRGASPILNARLPADHAGRRVGKPDILVAAVGGGYHAVDIKHHHTLDERREDGTGSVALCSGFGEPDFAHAAPLSAFTGARNEADLLQLAHYQRMLEACGFAAADGRWGAIIGVEEALVWYDLDAAMWRTPSASSTSKLRSSMERYDFEFDFRLDIIAVAQRHQAEPSEPLLVVPVRCSECPECPWREVCIPQLNRGSGDVSLIPYVGFKKWRAHRDAGVADRATLAGLDPVADAPRYEGSGLTGLAEQIDQARAALGSSSVYRRRGIESPAVPRADVEIDVDMENIEAGCYLWGALVTDRSGRNLVTPGYHSVVTWDSMTQAVETANSLRFWRWFDTIRRQVAAAGLTFRAYCYNAQAENRFLYRLATQAGLTDEINAFVRSDEWVDMWRVWETQMITGGPAGLKVVATLAGFSWGVDEPGGGESMLKYDVAVGTDEAAAAAARDWILTYNRGDVEATYALREWMTSAVGAALPSIGAGTAPMNSAESHTTARAEVAPAKV